MGTHLPSGTVTFLFTDVEGSTKLLQALGAEGYGDALATHRRYLREAFTRHGGVEVDTQGDAFFVAFPTAPGALAAAAEAREALEAGPIKVRMGLHTGTPHLTDEGYVGADVHRAARIAAAGHGGQILVSAATAHLVEAGALRDLGAHRLKDLSAPERIYQIGHDEHPPLKTLHQTNLPVPATPFLGREAELSAIGALLVRDEVRLLTLTGTGGTGKTRLALQAAALAADHFPGGVWWVPLAPLRDPALVLESAATALGATGDLGEQIGDRRLLLLLDNFEHLTAAAAAGLAPLMARCPKLTLLVTSREPLHLAGEHEYAVDPLAPPEAVELFLTRAVAAKRDFVANGEVAAICERLDHLPLAIELAAARVKVLSPAALLGRLEQRLPLLAGGARDLPERQRTLRATIEWSHELLSAEEQRLFARLAVFRGGWTFEAAERVADADLDTLQSLVDKSLVRVRDTGRFWMLETIREFAVERLELSGEDDQIRQRHADYFLARAEDAQPHLGGDPAKGLELIEPEHDNLRAASDRLEAAGDGELILRLAVAMSEYWGLRGHLAEGERRLATALAASPDPTALRAQALIAHAPSADPERERQAAEEAIAIYQRLGDPRGLAHARYALANALAVARRWAEARDLMEESVEAFGRLGEPFDTVRARRGLAWMHEELGDVARYQELTEQNLAQARALGIRRIEARSLGALGMLALADGRLAEARAMIEESYRIDHALGNVIFISVDLARFAALAAAEGRDEHAATLLAKSEAIREEIGWTPEPWADEEFERTLAVVRERLPTPVFTGAYQRGSVLDLDDAVALALPGAPD